MTLDMYDLHNHLLPGIDDGPVKPEETLRIMEICADQGIKEVLATPHRKDVNENHSVTFLRKLISDIQSISAQSGNTVLLRTGMENHLDLDILKDIGQGTALTINSREYILVEMPWSGQPPYIEAILQQILQLGLIPIIAHPERMDMFHKDPKLLERMVRNGILMQITAGSIYGKLGIRIKNFTKDLLVNNLCHVIASDTHMSSGARAPDLYDGWTAAAGIIGHAEAAKMVSDTPHRILHG
jgi:protein-tyrosine phosphatase